jgi:hypothetical protein
VEYIKVSLSLAVGEPQRIAPKHVALTSDITCFGVGQEAARVDDDALPQQQSYRIGGRRSEDAFNMSGNFMSLSQPHSHDANIQLNDCLLITAMILQYLSSTPAACMSRPRISTMPTSARQSERCLKLPAYRAWSLRKRNTLA